MAHSYQLNPARSSFSNLPLGCKCFLGSIVGEFDILFPIVGRWGGFVVFRDQILPDVASWSFLAKVAGDPELGCKHMEDVSSCILHYSS